MSHARLVAKPPDVLVARKAETQHGRISTAQLNECGLDDAAIRVRLARGQLHRVHRAVYAVGHEAWSVDAHFMAAVLAGGRGAVLSHLSAAMLWGFMPWRLRDGEIIVRGAKGRMQDGLRVHRHRLHPDEVTRRYDIPVTTAARACLDIAEELAPKPLRRAVRQAQAENHADVRQIADVLGRANGHRGAKKLTDLIATGPAPTRSELEDIVLDLLLRGGLPHPDVNQPLYRLDRKIVPDFRWPAQRLVVEADGSAWHDGKLAREDDTERQAVLEATGERVIRITFDQAIAKPEQSVGRVLAAWRDLRR